MNKMVTQVDDNILEEELYYWIDKLKIKNINVNYFNHTDVEDWNSCFHDRENGSIDPKKLHGKSLTDDIFDKKTGKKRGQISRFWFNVKRFNELLAKGDIGLGYVQMVVYHEALHAKYPNQTEKWITNKSDSYFGALRK